MAILNNNCCTNTVKSTRVKDKYGKLEQLGVYQIPLKNVDSQKDEIYIGATSRNLKDRLNEHRADIKKGLQSTALARRAYEHHIKIEWERSKIVQKVRDIRELQTAEEIRILEGTNEGTVINERQSLNLPLPWKYALKHGVK